MKAVFNFTVVETTKIPTDLQNRAFLYGDGLFETILVQNGTIKFLADHYLRLIGGMAVLQMQLPTVFSLEAIQNSIFELIKTCQLGDNARVRMHVWRKPGGLYTPENTDVDFLITAQPLVLPIVSIKETAIFYEEIPLSYSIISSFKTTSALPYVMAGLARKAANASEAILLNTHGFVAECVASNIFWLRNGKLYTPALESGCIAGIMRKNIINRMQANGLKVLEGLFAKAELVEAEAVFCCNVAGIQWITSIEGFRFEPNASLTVILTQLLNG